VPPLKVMITVDTEIWPSSMSWSAPSRSRPGSGIDADYERCILGRTPSGDYGLDYLLQTLNRHQLRGIFFAEALLATSVGLSCLQDTARRIREARQEIQLHVHTEWAVGQRYARGSGRPSQLLSDYSADDQAALIGQGLENLRAVGVEDVIAMRAGNMSGNRDTLNAVHAMGLALDMSLDPSQSKRIRALLRDLNKGERDEGLSWTIPLSCVEDFPGHFRPTQLTALSFSELREALMTAYIEGWPQFVILLHSFELVHRSRSSWAICPHTINIRRWNQMCKFIAENPECFVTVGCRNVLSQTNSAHPGRIARTSMLHTAWRVAEQGASRLIYCR
jgi:hypothetical protein